jgi:hypothetical protein
MPNGKGTLDCCYCVHFRGNARHHEPGACAFHGVTIPASANNRVCVHFDAAESYFREQGFSETIPPARRFTWFREDLEPGVLYEFCYNTPYRIDGRTVLRVFDYDRREWVKPPDAGQT